jgi:hypothetical protein
MSFDWLAWSNPVAIWWVSLLVVSSGNIALWLLLRHRLRKMTTSHSPGIFRIKLLVALGAAYVFGCAFRAVFPRADVQRICLFDTWLSSIFVGRSVATVAEVCFVIQWAIVLRQLAIMTKSDTARNISSAIVPLILLAEGCSWYAVITTNYLGNALENSLWTVTFLLIAAALVRLWVDFHGVFRLVIGSAVVGIAGYVAFMLTVDVPMYFDRWQADLMSGKELLGLFAGLQDMSSRWAVTHDITEWRDEIAWMTLYFSTAVWSSLALCGFGLIKDVLPKYCRSLQRPAPAVRLSSVRVRGG